MPVPRRAIHSWTEETSPRQTPLIHFEYNDYVKTASTTSDSRQYEENKPKRANIKKSKSIFLKFLGSVDHYCETSTLHGLRYVGDPNITYGERFFWLTSFLIAAAFAVYFIASLYTKFNKNPVIMSFSPTVSTLNEIPFPAVTVCNVNVVKKSLANNIMKYGSNLEKQLLSDYCDDRNTTFNDTGGDGTENVTTDWNIMKRFMLEIGQSCDQMVTTCLYQMDNCAFFINPVLTDEGVCCTFNRLPFKYSLRDELDATLNETYPDEIIDWNPENGFPPDSNLDALPKRTKGSGGSLGLTLILDALVDEYYCSTTNSLGFKVLLSNPIDMPKMADYGFLLSPGFEIRARIKPSIKDASKSIQTIDVDKRECFFASEKYLKFFRMYTERNCQLECHTNYTFSKCSCVPYYLPKNSKMQVCGKSDEECVYEAKRDIDLNRHKNTHCHCLPGCFEITFEQALSFGSISSKSELLVKPEVRKDKSLKYFKENMAIIHIFFQENKFIKYTKSELYGFSEFLSNTGGLLGLFLGFSFLSAVEIIYYISIRLICNVFKKRRQISQMKKHVHNTDDYY